MATTKKQEATVHKALANIAFLYGEATHNDELTVRAMVVRGAKLKQINYSITAAAVNPRIEIEDKARYAFGVLRNLMMAARPEHGDGRLRQEAHVRCG